MKLSNKLFRLIESHEKSVFCLISVKNQAVICHKIDFDISLLLFRGYIEASKII